MTWVNPQIVMLCESCIPYDSKSLVTEIKSVVAGGWERKREGADCQEAQETSRG